MKKLKNKAKMLRRNGAVIESVEAVLRPEERKSMSGKICGRGRF